MKNNLRVLMAMHKKTLTDIHKATGISVSTLSSIKREESKNPGSLTLVKIAKYFGVTLDEIIDINEEQ